MNTSEEDLAPAASGDPLEPLVGRNCALDLFDRALTGVRDGQPTMIEFVGDPGTGKTRLLREVAARARRAGVPVLAAAGRDGGQVQGALASLLDASATPLLLLVDDLHTVSPATAALLGRLAQVPPPGLLWVTAYRPRQMPSCATAALAAGIYLSRRAVTLSPLDPASVAALLGLPEGRAARRVHLLSGGVPRYVLAYRPGALDGPVAALRGLPTELPVDVTGAVQLDLDGLTDEQRQMLEVVSVCPGGFEPALAGALAGRGPEVTSDLLDALVAADLLRTDPAEASTLSFRHEVDRTVVYRSLSPGRRRRLHATAASVLRDAGHPVGRYAEHLSASGQCAEPATADALIEAAESALAPRLDAIRWLTNVQRLLPAAEFTEPRRTRLEFAMADALVGAGHLRQARTLLQELTRRPLGDCDQRLRALAARARVERLLGRPFDAYALVLPHRDERVAPRSRFLLSTEAAIAGVLSGSVDAAEHARGLDLLAAQTGEPVCATTAAVVQSFVAAYSDCGIPVPETLDRASSEVDALADTDLAQHPDLLALLGWAEYFHERERSALHHFDRALDICCRSGLVALTPWLLVGRCAVTARLGNLERARVEGEDAEEVAVAMGVDPLVALARAYRAIAVAWRGGPAAARQLADAAVLDAGTRRGNWYDGASQRVAARLRFLAGDRAGSTSALLRACGGDGLDQVELTNRACWASALAEMAHKAGRRDTAARWLTVAERYAERLGLRGQSALTGTARARLTLEADPRRAAELAAAAADTFATLGWRLEEASARLVRARALCEAREWAAAEVELAETRRIAELVDSPPLRRAVAGEQSRAAGAAGRLPDAVHGGELTLTRREWDIARLVAAGASNAEAADQVYVTVKTVEAHLTRIFRKTGVSSRAGLAALLVSGGVNHRGSGEDRGSARRTPFDQ
ncbi:ATP-, maltotriose-and DNA-dependent transcriptional regulator MalT [Micromonospora coriariae]|uniref:ATP-, maltotriose-and DNA-dependent transcriptional regulator MalT n=1 Tax=Micromonospora coriariae TaxID=285665 RepID=A0A1C4XV86_9ACTN|nr:LuxR family transcriptional regulator [Micromonospora coriariae]SCF12011.1 ATP-, maltotriose-and DNA-dependent transcriptional regulator MalT [Micromonospora coriariae]